MKNVLMVLTVLVAVSQAHALSCSLSKENPNKAGQYDQSFFSNVEVLKGKEQQLILVKPNGEVDTDFDYAKHTGDVKAYDKSFVAAVSKSKSADPKAMEILSLGIVQVDISQPNNITPGMAFGFSELGRLAGVIDMKNKLMLTCYQF